MNHSQPKRNFSWRLSTAKNLRRLSREVNAALKICQKEEKLLLQVLEKNPRKSAAVADSRAPRANLAPKEKCPCHDLSVSDKKNNRLCALRRSWLGKRNSADSLSLHCSSLSPNSVHHSSKRIPQCSHISRKTIYPEMAHFKEVFQKKNIKKSQKNEILPKIENKFKKSKESSPQKALVSKEQFPYQSVQVPKRHSKKKGRLNSLKQVLLTVLSGCELSQEQVDRLDRVERQIYRAILCRKTLNVSLKGPFEFRAEFLNDYCQLSPKRRNEELLKFVFMQGLKYLKNHYIDQNFNARDKTVSKKAKENAFYQFYFGETAKRLKQSLGSFYLPGKRGTARSINKQYQALVSQSKALMNDLGLLLKGKFIVKNAQQVKVVGFRELATKNLEAKLELKILQWEGFFRRLSESKALALVLEKISSTRFKLPWSISEVTLAIAHIQSVFPLKK